MNRVAAVCLIALALAGCGPTKTTYYRLDGRTIPPDPRLVQQFETDRSICLGDAQKAWLAGGEAGPYRNQATDQVFQGCMAGRGYRAERSS